MTDYAKIFGGNRMTMKQLELILRIIDRIRWEDLDYGFDIMDLVDIELKLNKARQFREPDKPSKYARFQGTGQLTLDQVALLKMVIDSFENKLESGRERQILRNVKEVLDKAHLRIKPKRSNRLYTLDYSSKRTEDTGERTPSDDSSLEEDLSFQDDDESIDDIFDFSVD